MEKERASETAVLTAAMRGAHLLMDHEPWVFADTLAGRFIGIENRAQLHSLLSSVENELAPISATDLMEPLIAEARASVNLRSRFAEDELEKAIGAGVTQYVILGAGYDSFAYRRPELAGSVSIFEVDHPATLLRKQARLRELRMDHPPHLVFVPLDFEEQSLLDGLRAKGFRHDQPAFFSWLGVTWFLTEEAISQTLKEIGSLASGTELVFDYPIVETALDEEALRLSGVISSMGASRSEPVYSRFEPADLTRRLKIAGFPDVWHLTVDDANARYFSGRTDELRSPRLPRLLKARV